MKTMQLATGVFLTLTLSYGIAGNDSPPLDPLASLAQARVKYEQTIERARTDVLDALSRREGDLLAKDKPDQRELEKLKQQRQEFIESGAWPGAVLSAALPSRLKQARGAMVAAYKSAKSECLKRKDNALANILVIECERFEKDNDLIAWGENLVADIDATRRTLSAAEASAALEVDAQVPPQYRIEVQLDQEMAGPATPARMILELPLSDGRRIAIPTVEQSEPQGPVLLTIRDSHASADLGVARPIDLAGATSDDNRKIVLRCTSGSVTVKSIRIKPVGELSDTRAAKPNATRERSARKEDATVLLPLGSKWRGTSTANGNTKAIRAVVTQVDRDSATLRVTTDINVRDWIFAVRGNQLAIVRMVNVSRANLIKNAQISGTIANDHIELSGKFIWQGAGGGGGPSTFAVSLDRS